MIHLLPVSKDALSKRGPTKIEHREEKKAGTNGDHIAVPASAPSVWIAIFECGAAL
jgi:hypothetical protein